MKYFDRVWETTTTTGTGSYTLDGAKSAAYRAFGDVLADNDYVEYFVRDSDASNWERVWGQYDAGNNTLTRNLIESSTGSLIDWGSGTKEIYIAPPAASLNDEGGIYVGASRPTWLPANSLWIKSDASPVTLYVYDGTADRIMGTYTSSGFIPYRNDTALGSAATKDAGTLAGNVLLLAANNKLPALDGSALTGLPFKVAQIVTTQVGTTATGTTQIPADDSIPQITEGTQFLSRTITPKSATNRLLIDVRFFGQGDSNIGPLTVALFRGGTANALAAGMDELYDAAAHPRPVGFAWDGVAGSTDLLTFTVRAGAGQAGTLRMNGAQGAQRLGGALMSSITIMEYVP